MEYFTNLYWTNDNCYSESSTFDATFSLDHFTLIENKMKSAGFDSNEYPIPLDMSEFISNTEINAEEEYRIEQRIKYIISHTKKGIHQHSYDSFSNNTMQCLTGFDFNKATNYTKSVTLDFSPERKAFSKLALPYMSGKYEGNKKTKVTEIAKYGHIFGNSGIRNMQNAFSIKHEREATAEHLFIFSMYFKLNPEEARAIFHMCKDLRGRELESFEYAGGALYHFLENKIYDYDLFMNVLCKGLVDIKEPLLEVFSNNDSWKSLYSEYSQNKKV